MIGAALPMPHPAVLRVLVFMIIVLFVARWLMAGARAATSRSRAVDLHRLSGSGAGELLPAPRWLVERFDRAGLGDSASSLLGVWLLAGALPVVALAITGIVTMAVMVLVAVVIGPLGALWLMRSRRDRQIELELPAALEAMGRAVRSGSSFSQALGEAAAVVTGPLRRDLSDLDARVALGQPFVVVVEAWAKRRGLVGVRLAGAALAFSHGSGGAHARALDGLADSLRDRRALEREVAALAAQARMSAMVVGALPIGFLVLSTSLDPNVALFLFTTPAGLACLIVGLGLDLAGFLWMRTMTGAIK